MFALPAPLPSPDPAQSYVSIAIRALTYRNAARLSAWGSETTKACKQALFLPSGAYLQRLHHSNGSSSQGVFNISDLNDWDKMND